MHMDCAYARARTCCAIQCLIVILIYWINICPYLNIDIIYSIVLTCRNKDQHLFVSLKNKNDFFSAMLAVFFFGYVELSWQNHMISPVELNSKSLDAICFMYKHKTYTTIHQKHIDMATPELYFAPYIHTYDRWYSASQTQYSLSSTHIINTSWVVLFWINFANCHLRIYLFIFCSLCCSFFALFRL